MMTIKTDVRSKPCDTVTSSPICSAQSRSDKANAAIAPISKCAPKNSHAMVLNRSAFSGTKGSLSLTLFMIARNFPKNTNATAIRPSTSRAMPAIVNTGKSAISGPCSAIKSACISSLNTNITGIASVTPTAASAINPCMSMASSWPAASKGSLGRGKVIRASYY